MIVTSLFLFVFQVKPHLLSKDFDSLVDPRMVGGAPPDNLFDFFNIALLCVQKNSNDRPEMQEVAVRLASIGMAAGVVALEDVVSIASVTSSSFVDEIDSAYRLSGISFNAK